MRHNLRKVGLNEPVVFLTIDSVWHPSHESSMQQLEDLYGLQVHITACTKITVCLFWSHHGSYEACYYPTLQFGWWSVQQTSIRSAHNNFFGLVQSVSRLAATKETPIMHRSWTSSRILMIEYCYITAAQQVDFQLDTWGIRSQISVRDPLFRWIFGRLFGSCIMVLSNNFMRVFSDGGPSCVCWKSESLFCFVVGMNHSNSPYFAHSIPSTTGRTRFLLFFL